MHPISQRASQANRKSVSQSLFSWRVLPIDTLDQWKTESGGDNVLLRVLERLSSPPSAPTCSVQINQAALKVSQLPQEEQRRQMEWMLSGVCPSSIEAHGQQGRYMLDVCMHWGLYTPLQTYIIYIT